MQNTVLRRIGGPASRAFVAAIAIGAGPGSASAACDVPAGRLVAAEAVVEVRAVGDGAWVRVAPGYDLCRGDQVAVRSPGRAAVVLAGDVLVRLDQETTLNLEHAEPDADAELGLQRGVVHVISRLRKRFGVTTPFVNALVDGTEFTVEAGTASGRIVVAEGLVRARNARGERRLAAGEAAEAQSGAAPQPVVVQPVDAVRWAIHYPQIVWLGESTRAGLAPALGDAVSGAQRAMAAGRTAEALEILDGAAGASPPAPAAALRIGLLLALGRVDDARRQLDAGPRGDASFDALDAVIRVARNEVDAASASAARAIATDPASASAQLARSYALQAQRELPRALDAAVRATELAPEHPFAWARRAELELALGRVKRGRESIREALARADGLPRARALLGFSDLLDGRVADAAAGCADASAADPAEPLARLCRGLAGIRGGDLDEGRRQLELAVLLAPTDAELRSTLGRAYLQERRGKVAADQFDLARRLDPASPTPWYFDAFRKLRDNDPLGAIADEETAIALNENRAVLRSSELLDADRAARGASLGAAYRAAGFDQPMFAAAMRALDDDPLGPAAHRLSADGYAALPRFESARVSEMLQTSLRQPLGAAPLAPSLWIASLPVQDGPRVLSPEETSDLFNRGPWHFSTVLTGGTQDTYGGTLIASRAWERAQLSAGAFLYRSDGVDDGADVDLAGQRVAFRFDPAAQTALHAEAWQSDEAGGDVVQRFFDDAFGRRFDTERRVARLSFRHEIGTDAEILGSHAVTRIRSDNETTATLGPVRVTTRLEEEAEGRDYSLQYLLNRGAWGLTLGGGHYDEDRETGAQAIVCCPRGPLPLVTRFPESQVDIVHDSVYAYLRRSLLPTLDAHAGIGRQRVDFDDDSVSRERTTGKLGLVFRPVPAAAFRVAWFERVAGTFGQPTLEPTQFAGFVQQHDDPRATFSRALAAGVDARLGRDVMVGAEWMRRRLDIPNLNCSPAPCDTEWNARRHRAYVAWQARRNLALTAEWHYESTRMTDHRSGTIANPIEVATERLPLRAWFALPGHWSLAAEALRLRQKVGRLTRGALDEGSEAVWLANLRLRHARSDVGWSVEFEVRNLFDRDFRYQDPNLLGTPGIPQYQPERSAFVFFAYRY
jgi:Flp pilus assembly protein TadD